MQVGHRLASLVLAVDDQAIAIDKTQFLGQFHRHQVHVAKQRGVFFLQRVMRRDHLARNDEHMHWRLGMNVVESQALIVRMDDFGRDFSFDDLEKNVVAKHAWHREESPDEPGLKPPGELRQQSFPLV